MPCCSYPENVFAKLLCSRTLNVFSTAFGYVEIFLYLLQLVQSLQPLQMVDPRVQVLPWDGYAWSTYRSLEAEGHLWDVEASSWQERMSPVH